MKIQLMVIDPQNDFCDSNGSLFVPGADEDMERLAAMVKRLGSKLGDIHVTLDSHQEIDVAHPAWWKDSSGAHPTPFTIISPADVESGIWNTAVPGLHSRSLDYLRDLQAGSRYPHCIWPEHCLIGSWGACVNPSLADALAEWKRLKFASVNYVTKGSNPFTEHFSAVRAEVPDPTDPTTQLNAGFVQTLEQADIILLAGEALSHCLANTVRDTADAFSDPQYVQKMHLLTDATSSVPTFEQMGKDFISELTAKGMKLTTTEDFLK